MTLRLTHPRRKRLAEWLADGEDGGITAHVETCERCASTLEELSVEAGLPDLEPDAELGRAIRESLPSPEGLNERVMLKIAERERAEQEMSLFIGLISLPKDAVELMMPPVAETDDPPAIDPAPEDHHREEDQ